jgi:hypothetical protein
MTTPSSLPFLFPPWSLYKSHKRYSLNIPSETVNRNGHETPGNTPDQVRGVHPSNEIHV